MTSAPGRPEPTPGQTIGPFFGDALPFDGGSRLVPADHPAAVRLSGAVLDGRGEPVPDALLELWQVDGGGRVVAEPGSRRRDGPFTGWGRAPTDRAGHYAFTTLAPGAPAGRAPYFALAVFARGLLHRLLTRAYLPDDPAALAADPLLAALPADRRATLVATARPDGYGFDVRLQGERETVFLAH